jgi:hypothetical protein
MVDPRAHDGIPWERLFPVPALLRAMRLAVGTRALFLALLGAGLTQLGWTALAFVIGRNLGCDSVFCESNGAPFSTGPKQSADALLFASTQAACSNGLLELPRAAFENCFTAWQTLSRPFLTAFYPGVDVGWRLYFLLCGFWAILVWSVFGIMIARSAAVALARDEQLSGRRLRSFAFEKWRSVFAAPLTPLLGIGLLTIPLAILGLLLRLNFGLLLAGLLWPFALVAALAMAVLAVGLILGWPLMWAAIAAEGSDSFDAVSRAYAYVFHRPLLVFWFALQAIAIGAIGVVLTRLFCGVLLTMCAWGVSWGAGSAPDEAIIALAESGSGVGLLGARLICFWTGLVAILPSIFKFSFLWTAATAIYFALRHEVDATEFDEVYLPEEKEAPHVLPTLGTDEAGVPKVEA